MCVVGATANVYVQEWSSRSERQMKKEREGRLEGNWAVFIVFFFNLQCGETNSILVMC